MSRSLLIPALRTFALLALFVSSQDVSALEIHKNHENSAWSSAAHLGYAIEDASTTGFDRVAGSLVLLDILRSVDPDWSFGLRTTASGGRQMEAEFYRLGTGPMVSYRINEEWSAQLALGFFNETATTPDGTAAYTSRGQSVFLGWERSMVLANRVEATLGGFFTRHWGNVTLASAIPSGSEGRFAGVTSNRGGSRGIEVGLRMNL